jgi:hypothetical protein
MVVRMQIPLGKPSSFFPTFRSANPENIAEVRRLFARQPWILATRNDPIWRDPADWIVLLDIEISEIGGTMFGGEPSAWSDPDEMSDGVLRAGTRLRFDDRVGAINVAFGGIDPVFNLSDPSQPVESPRTRRPGYAFRTIDPRADDAQWTIGWLAASACVAPVALADLAACIETLAILEVEGQGALMRWCRLWNVDPVEGRQTARQHMAALREMIGLPAERPPGGP